MGPDQSQNLSVPQPRAHVTGYYIRVTMNLGCSAVLCFDCGRPVFKSESLVVSLD